MKHDTGYGLHLYAAAKPVITPGKTEGAGPHRDRSDDHDDRDVREGILRYYREAGVLAGINQS